MHRQCCHTLRICNLTLLLISQVRSFIESDVADTDNIVLFENTAPINQNKKVKKKKADKIDQINRSGIFEWYNVASVRYI